MSSILDALKKSDQERLRQTPLPGISRYESQRKHSSGFKRIVLSLLAIVLLGFSAYTWYRGAPGDASDSTSTTEHTASPSVRSASQQPVPEIRATENQNPEQSARQEAVTPESSSPPVVTSSDQPATIAPQLTLTEQTEPVRQQQPVQSVPEPVEQATAVAAETLQAPAPVQPSTSVQDSVQASETVAIDAMSLSEIDASTREMIQSFRISIVVYDPDPQRRFALINGQRLSEGDAINDEIRLERILRGEMIMNLRGERVRVPSR